jgi:hypothetical protein
MKELNRIEKRAIEAQAIVPFVDAVARKIGKEKALAILREVNEQEAFQRGRQMRVSDGQQAIQELVEEVATWGDGGIWEMEVLQQTSTTYFFNVHRCPYYERYRELGLEKYGVEFSCCRDEPFARGFHSQLRLIRTKTIMENADYCDFRYFLHGRESP